MLTIKKLSDVPIKDACEAWNKGFIDYYVNMQMTNSQFTYRLGWDELSPDYSFIAYFNSHPAGIILNGIMTSNGKRVAWNGGTAVAVTFRGKGIARKLMESTMELYEQENVDIASLEAFSINHGAIRLYESCGYHVVDHLMFLKKTGSNEKTRVNFLDLPGFSLHRGLPHEVRDLSFYQHDAPWKTQWNFIRHGESIIMKNCNGEPVAYALYQKSGGKTIIYQCSVDERLPNKLELFQSIIDHLIKTEPHTISTYNLPGKNQLLLDILKRAGFKEEYTDQKVPLKQVLMKKVMI